MAPKKVDKKRRQNRVMRPVALNCPYCKDKNEPTYKKYNELANYLTDRAKIMPKTRTGLCAKHQRAIALEIKRARHVALLPYTVTLR